MHVSSNRPVSEDEEKLMMYSPGGPFIMVAPVVTSWAVAGQRMVFLHMYLQTRVTLKAFPVATPRGRSSSSHEGEQTLLSAIMSLTLKKTCMDCHQTCLNSAFKWNKAVSWCLGSRLILMLCFFGSVGGNALQVTRVT